jgi:pyridoxine kinase
MNLISIQSHVAYGHVGNAAATFPLQRMGVEVWPIHTVQFSNHTGYGEWTGRVFDGDMIRDVVAGIEKRGVLGECDGILSGYMGSADIGTAILETVATVKQTNVAAQYCCDPVIGDVGRGIFVREGIPEFMRDKAVPAADIITPNQFELEYLAGHETRTMAQAFAAIDALHKRGPRAVMVTSLHTEHTPAECIDLLASDAKGRFHVRTPKLRSKSTARVTPSRPCSLRAICARAILGTRFRSRLLRFSASFAKRWRPARARSFWSKRRMRL